MKAELARLWDWLFDRHCIRRGHLRSKGRAYLDQDEQVKSYCRRCGIPMAKSPDGEWKTTE